MIRQITIQAEPHDDDKSVFRLSIDATLIAKGVSVGQACYLVGEVLQRMGDPDGADLEAFDANDDIAGRWEMEGGGETFSVSRRVRAQRTRSWLIVAPFCSSPERRLVEAPQLA